MGSVMSRTNGGYLGKNRSGINPKAFVAEEGLETARVVIGIGTVIAKPCMSSWRGLHNLV